MRKEELSAILHSLNIPVNEGIVAQKNVGNYPLIVYWKYLEEDVHASDEGYENKATYQISFFADAPQHTKFLELRQVLREHGIRPMYSHEYIENDPLFSKTWHTYFAIEVTEDIEEVH